MKEENFKNKVAFGLFFYLQFILPSHHPYIINGIGMEYWKVVSRTGGVISTKNADEFKLGDGQ